MSQGATSLVIGARNSQLAIWQADSIASRLRTLYPGLEVTLKHFVTHGDRVIDKSLPEIGGKGVFTAELEAALAQGTIDLAVHSLKDLPTKMDERFTIVAIPPRAAPYDALISRGGQKLAGLALGSIIGTSSLRRVAQIKAARPDLNIMSLRGNVPTRVSKAFSADDTYDAVILAQAGLDRLNLSGKISEILPPEVMLPAPAQGALAAQCRADDKRTHDLLAPLDDVETRIAVEAERAFLNALDAGCRLPVAALAHRAGSALYLTGRVASLDGKQMITVQDTGAADRTGAAALGKTLAEAALARGADVLLQAVRGDVR